AGVGQALEDLTTRDAVAALLLLLQAVGDALEVGPAGLLLLLGQVERHGQSLVVPAGSATASAGRGGGGAASSAGGVGSAARCRRKRRAIAPSRPTQRPTGVVASSSRASASTRFLLT